MLRKEVEEPPAAHLKLIFIRSSIKKLSAGSVTASLLDWL